MSLGQQFVVAQRIALLWLLCFYSFTAYPGQTVNEPDAYRTSNYNSEVPLGVTGAKVFDSAQQLDEFLRSNPDSIMLDVFPAARKPDNLAATELWIEPSRETISGAIWLANTGYGDPPAELKHFFSQQLAQLTARNKHRAIIIFCEPQCWHSWNASKRAVALGYTNIYWYRSGVSGWQAANMPAVTQQPVRP
jgi:PQQ-dependent catabolism-associated CXXCW motif protein